MKAATRMSLAGAVLALALASPAAAQNAQKPVPTNVQLTFHIIEADGFEGDDAEIRPIVTELRKLFRFRGYRLVSKSVLTGTSWPPSSVEQRVASDDDDRTFSITAQMEGSAADAVRISVVLEGRFTTTRNGREFVDGGRLINASVNLQNGKTVVLGSSRHTGKAAAIILAVTPTINP